MAELNPLEGYVKFVIIRDIPRVYKSVKVGLLSPASLIWLEDNECVTLPNTSIVLGVCNRSSNGTID